MFSEEPMWKFNCLKNFNCLGEFVVQVLISDMSWKLSIKNKLLKKIVLISLCDKVKFYGTFPM